jgi:hypothetical protein
MPSSIPNGAFSLPALFTAFPPRGHELCVTAVHMAYSNTHWLLVKYLMIMHVTSLALKRYYDVEPFEQLEGK